MFNDLKEIFTNIQKLSLQGQLKKAEEEIDQLSGNNQLDDDDKLITLLLKATIYNRHGEPALAYSLASDVLSKSESQNKTLLIIDSLLCELSPLIKLRKYDECLQKITYGQTLLETLTFLTERRKLFRKAAFIDNTGSVYYYKKDFSSALTMFENALAIFESIGETVSIASTLHNIGMVFHSKGEFDQALDYYHRSIHLFGKTADIQVMSRVFNNIGNIYLAQGSVDIALDYYQKGQILRETIGNIVGIAMTTTDIARGYALKGDFDQALINYKKSLELIKSTLDPSRDIIFSTTLFYFLRFLIIRHDTSDIDLYIEQLKSINDNNPDKLISQHYRLIKAFQLKNSPRNVKKVEAQQIFQQISQENVIDYELTVFATLNLCEMLIEELYTSNASEILVEIKNLIKKLFDMATIQNSYPLLIEIDILESKLALVELNISEAKEFLLKADYIAKAKQLHQLIIRISDELDAFLEQVNMWERFANQNIGLKERIELSRLFSTINHTINSTTINIPNIKNEKPVMILIANFAGTAVFSKTFDKQSPINIQLISGFLVSINAFGKEVFSNSESLNYIKYQEYSLFLKHIDPLLFCYVYKGNSSIAEQKIIKFVQLIHESQTIWEDLCKANFQTISIEKSQQIIDLVNKTFIFGS